MERGAPDARARGQRAHASWEGPGGALGACLPSVGISTGTHEFRTSTAGRSVTTAGIALAPLGAVATRDPRLVEIDVGQWTGETLDDLVARGEGPRPEEPHIDFCLRAPGGETLKNLWSRCEAVLCDLSRPTVLFTHGLTGRVLRTIAMGWGRDRLHVLPGGQGVVHRVTNRQHEVLTPGEVPFLPAA